jgi:hypothetical protein
MNRAIKFRAFIDGEMIDADALAFEEYLPVSQLLYGCNNIMQFTGLLDKNGKEIYEGDIINSSYFKLAICVWWQSGWYLERDGNHFTFNTAKHTLEIIGNVYQHPDLLI